MKAAAWMVGGLLLLPLVCTAEAMNENAVALAGPVSESDYLAEVPTVISVSRIPQSLADTPGAVTILDREFIRMSGARDVVSLLSYVPGFQTTDSFETDAPMATYHGRTDDWANRIQVLVDGRSVYSGLLQGSAGIGFMALAVDDIERIEVLRGSNSATYGARAFLGVVNIVSRDPRDTIGASANLTNGENGISDRGMRIGWHGEDASYRISANTVSDNGLRGAFGANQTERSHFSSHLGLDAGSDLDLRAGGVEVNAGRGDVTDSAGNPARIRMMGSAYVQGDWHRPLNDSNDLAVSYSHTLNVNRDQFSYMQPGPYYMANINFNGVEYVDRLTVQQSTRQSATLRTVVGGELSREQDVSPASFDQFDVVTSNFERVFGSAEWRLDDAWVLNAGALAEHSDLGGDSFSPRLMMNWHFLPGHTFRIGASTAFRPPSAYEKYAQVQYYDVNGANPTGYYVYNNGSVGSEKLFSKELGYLYAPDDLRVNADVRLFSEQIIDGIASTDTQIVGVQPYQYMNSENYQINGAEWQLNWTPVNATKVFFSQTWTNILVESSASSDYWFRTAHSAPRYAASLSVMHTLDSGQQMSLLYQTADDVALMSISSNPWLFSMQRTDLRFAQPFRISRYRAELALTVQNIGAPYQDGDWKFYFDRRAMLTLKIED